MPHKNACLLSDEQARHTLGSCFPELLFHNRELSERVYLEIIMYLCVNELIMPHNVGVKNALENMKELLALYKMVIGNYRPLLDGERYLTDKEVAHILKVSR